MLHQPNPEKAFSTTFEEEDKDKKEDKEVEETFEEWAPGRVRVTPDRSLFIPTPEASPANATKAKKQKTSGWSASSSTYIYDDYELDAQCDAWYDLYD